MAKEKTFEDTKAEVQAIFADKKSEDDSVETEEVVEEEVIETEPEAEVETEVEDEAEQESDDNEIEAENTDDLDDDSDGNSAVVTDELLERAVLAGISIKDARKYTDPGMLERVIELVLVKSNKEQKDIAPDVEHDTDIDDSILDSIPDLNPDDYDPEVVGAFSGVKQVVKTLLDQVKLLQEENKNVSAQNTLSWIDSAFESLDSDYHEFLGKGPKTALSEDGIEFKNRSAVVERMDILAAGYKAVNKPVPSNSVLFKDAVEGIFGSKIVNKKINTKLAKRKTQHINRADKSKPSEKDVVKKSTREELVDLVSARINEFKR